MQKIKNISFNSKTLSAAVLVVVILISIIVFYINSSINKINYQETQPNKEFNTDNNYIPIGNNNDEDDPLANKNIINIILIGKDKSSEEGTRSDSIIIATIKKKDKTLKLTSLMRDLYVPIPDQMDNRINAAYSLGGMELLSRTIEENFAIEIEGCQSNVI